MKRKGLVLIAAVLIAALLPVMPLKSVSNTVSVQAASDDICTVHVDTGYLALRSAKAYDSRNEIGELYTGDLVQVLNRNDSTYWYVYSPKYSLAGYVNKNYLIGGGALSPVPVSDTYKVSVATGYLALRSAKAYDYKNEIGELYTGDTVQVLNRDSSDYWYVYSPKLDKSGYVNRKYLVGADSSSGKTYTVKVEKNYLALRNAKGYNYYNEIGKLYTGDTVTLKDASDSTYWYVYSPKLNLSGYVNKNYLY